MISKKEKNAIEYLKNLLEIDYRYINFEINEEYINIVLDLIEKQQKEIEELKDNTDDNKIICNQIINKKEEEIEWHKKVISKILKI